AQHKDKSPASAGLFYGEACGSAGCRKTRLWEVTQRTGRVAPTQGVRARRRQKLHGPCFEAAQAPQVTRGKARNRISPHARRRTTRQPGTLLQPMVIRLA